MTSLEGWGSTIELRPRSGITLRHSVPGWRSFGATRPYLPDLLSLPESVRASRERKSAGRAAPRSALARWPWTMRQVAAWRRTMRAGDAVDGIGFGCQRDVAQLG